MNYRIQVGARCIDGTLPKDPGAIETEAARIAGGLETSAFCGPHYSKLIVVVNPREKIADGMKAFEALLLRVREIRESAARPVTIFERMSQGGVQ